ncbi:MAG TPA: methyltransferase domain-containing protein [Phycisphaerae bacterium]|nr:methyltransferase domain-containing protein [Phycisphaerae bacterium]
MKALEDLVCCPACRGDVRLRRGNDDEGAACACDGCGGVYPVTDGVVDFLPGQNGGKKSRGQRAMESERCVRIYEGRWWRGSRWMGWFFAISLSEEVTLVKRILDCGPADTVLDLACGPGLFTRSFAEGNSERTAIGLDLSWPMLRYAVRKAARLGMTNVTFLHGDAHCLPLRDGSLDGANCCGALHLFPDVRQVLGELKRAIRPGGASRWRARGERRASGAGSRPTWMQSGGAFITSRRRNSKGCSMRPVSSRPSITPVASGWSPAVSGDRKAGRACGATGGGCGVRRVWYHLRHGSAGACPAALACVR